jgi:hypothetical protein
MPITLSPQTQKLIEKRMKDCGCSSADELVQKALASFDEVQGEEYDQLDPETRAAIEEADAQSARGEGIPLGEAFAKLRAKHLKQ